MVDHPPLQVGRIGRPHGVKGEVTLLLWGDPEMFVPGAVMRTDDGRTLTVRAASPFRDRGLIVHFEGVASRTDAEGLRGCRVVADRPQHLDDGEFWPEDLIGLRAVSPSGEMLGVVTGVDFGIGQDRLVVTTDSGSEVVVPFVAALVGDPADGLIEVRDPGGLFP